MLSGLQTIRRTLTSADKLREQHSRHAASDLLAVVGDMRFDGIRANSDDGKW
jgi:hypothetical protein